MKNRYSAQEQQGCEVAKIEDVVGYATEAEPAAEVEVAVAAGTAVVAVAVAAGAGTAGAGVETGIGTGTGTVGTGTEVVAVELEALVEAGLTALELHFLDGTEKNWWHLLRLLASLVRRPLKVPDFQLAPVVMDEVDADFRHSQ